MLSNLKPAVFSERPDEAADAPSRTDAEREGPIYPVDRSFILEIHRDATFAQTGCIGRAEHIASGAVKRFSDSTSLLHFLADTVLGAPPNDAAVAPADTPASADEATAAGRR